MTQKINKEQLQASFQKVVANTKIMEEDKSYETILDPIKICMVAPRRTGKTSLLTALVNYITTKINNSKFQLIIDEDSSRTIAKFSDIIDKIHTVKKVGDDVSKDINTPPSGEIKEFKFDLVFKMTNTGDLDKQTVRIPLVVMDMPGGLVTLDNNAKSSDSLYKHYAAHRDESSIILLPFDSLLLIERPITADIDERDAFIQTGLSIKSVREEVCKWADNRSEDKHPCAIFIPVKCESYYSQSMNSQNAQICFNEFDTKYRSAIRDISNKAPQELEVSYVPLETVGCVRKDKSTFGVSEGEDNEKRIFHSFTKTSNEDNYLGAGVILATIFKRAFEQVADTYGEAKDYIDYIEGMNFFEKWILNIFNTLKVKNNEGFVMNFYKALDDMKKELVELFKSDSCYQKGFNHMILGKPLA